MKYWWQSARYSSGLFLVPSTCIGLVPVSSHSSVSTQHLSSVFTPTSYCFPPNTHGGSAAPMHSCIPSKYYILKYQYTRTCIMPGLLLRRNLFSITWHNRTPSQSLFKNRAFLQAIIDKICVGCLTENNSLILGGGYIGKKGSSVQKQGFPAR